MPTRSSQYDAVVIGGGHNGLVAAAYLSRAGLSVLVLERQPTVGGAAQTVRPFPGVDARLSRYAYLLSLFPRQVVEDLGLGFQTRQRAVASFTPSVRNGRHTGLLVSHADAAATAGSFRRLTGGDREYQAFRRLDQLTGRLARAVWPTLLQPLPSRDQVRARLGDDVGGREAWRTLVEEPLGLGLERLLADDLVRGLAFTNAKIGVLAHPHDPSLLQNRTFLYHVVGQGTGEWQVVVGGMGAVSAELERAARAAGAEIRTSAAVRHVHLGDGGGRRIAVEYVGGTDGKAYTVAARYVLSNVAPAVLNRMLVGSDGPAPSVPAAGVPAPAAEGSVFKVNLVLKRLPALRTSDYSSAQAFAGTFHLDEGYGAMLASHARAAAGQVPDRPPGELYCQTLSDPSTLSPALRAAGYQTLTLFGLDVPAKAFDADNAGVRQRVLGKYLAALNTHLAEPIEDCLAIDVDGRPCVEAKSPLDLEAELGLPRGHIFHTDLTWPFADNPAGVGTWGVETAHPNLFVCGSGAARGGCVSGIPGHNAARAVLASYHRA